MDSGKFGLISAFITYFFNNLRVDINIYKKLHCLYKIYLECITVRIFRNALSKLWTSSHDLEIERGRYSDTGRNQRICKLCNNKYWDWNWKFRFVLKCTRLIPLKEKYIPSKFYQSPNINKFIILMSSTNVDIIMTLALFGYCDFHDRNMLLNDIV